MEKEFASEWFLMYRMHGLEVFLIEKVFGKCYNIHMSDIDTI